MLPGRPGGVAVKLDHLVRRHARALMQVVDVLRDAAIEPLQAVKIGDRVVRRIGHRRPDHGIDDATELPVRPSARHAGDEFRIAQLVGIVPIPDAAGTTKVRNAGLGADSRPGEDDGPPRPRKQLAETRNPITHRPRFFRFRVGRRAAAPFRRAVSRTVG